MGGPVTSLEGRTKIEVWHRTKSGSHSYSFPMGAPVEEVLATLEHWTDQFRRAWAEQKCLAEQDKADEDEPETGDNGA